jgi:hypothetical protein
MMIPIRCKAGDLVEVRSAAEILATLDDLGCFEKLPFMPEMLPYCGRQYRVFRSAHKICDSTYYKDGRYLENTVFLEDLRCDGGGHDGCQAKCLILFKLAWLKPVSPARKWRLAAPTATPLSRDVAWLHTRTRHTNEEGATIYRCQTTDYLGATSIFKPFDLSIFLADLRSGNVGLSELVRGLLLLIVWHAQTKLKFGWRFWTWLYAGLHRRLYGAESPHIQGTIPKGAPTPDVRIGLEQGETVRVRTLSEIQSTLNVANRNRGMSFNAEMSPFCGSTYKVERKVTRIIDERTFKMLDMKNPCIMLEGVRCMARYHPEVLLCPKRVPLYFREAWLERVGDQS